MRTEKKKKIAIAGFSREGGSLLRFLRRSPLYKQSEIWVLDRNTELKLPRGVPGRLGPDYLADLKAYDLILRSPGIPYNLPEFISARKHGVAFTSATRLFIREAKKITGNKIIGVTGSKGKTTTATLIYQILKKDGRKVFFAGNVGSPMLDLLPKLDSETWLVLELSSFQLQDLDASPGIAVILDMFPEHQDAHGSLAEYYNAKKNIGAHQTSRDRLFYFGHNPVTRRLARAGNGRKTAVSEKGFELFRPEELRIRGLHAFRNAVMAAYVAEAAGVCPVLIRRAILRFPGVKHRLELVRALTRAGHAIGFYNDSASTNPNTTATALRAFPDTANILLVGGYDKNLDYAPFAEALRKSRTELVILFGSNRDKILKAIAGIPVPRRTAESLEEAVRLAWATARDLGADCAVLFSPGAASFDMFRNYADRGDRFRALAAKIR